MKSTPSHIGNSRIVLPSAQPMYAAAVRWRDEALVADRSLFSGQPIDGLAAARELIRDFIDQPDLGPRDFLSKVRDQLATTSVAGVQVAAELLYVHTLIVATDAFRSKNKLELVNNVARIRDGETTIVPDDLAEALRGGVVRPGQAYASYRWKMFAYLIRLFEAIKATPSADREAILTDWELFQDFVSAIDDQSVWSQRHALEHLLFPDIAPPILSRTDRSTIVGTFSSDYPGEQLDILQLTARLEPNVVFGQRSAVSYYRTPYRERWQGASDELKQYAAWSRKVIEGIDLDRAERDYKIQRLDRLNAVFRSANSGGDLHGAIHDVFTGLNLVDFRVADTFTKWVEHNSSMAAEAIRELAREPGPESVDRFLSFIPREAAAGIGARLSIASVLLMGLDPENLPPWPGLPTWCGSLCRVTVSFSAV